MNILFLSIALGDLSQNQGLYENLANEFKKMGHTMYVVAPSKKDKTTFKKESGIKVIRVKTNKFSGVSNIRKGLAYQKIIFQYLYFIRKYIWKVKMDLILTHSLPPEIGVIVRPLKQHYKCPFYLMQNDYTWQDAVSFGFFKKRSILCKYYQYLEKLSFELADCIGVPSKGNIEFIKKHYPALEVSKVKLLHLYQKPASVSNDKKTFREEYNLVDKFIVVYGGSMGVAQKIEHVITLAESCLDNEQIVFVIIGKGDYLEETKKVVRKRNIKNILFIDFLPQKQYLELLSSCNLGLIVLNEKLATPNFPSKTVSYFNLGIPVLASIDYVTDYGRFLTETKTGLWSYSGDNITFKENLLLLYSDAKLCEEFSLNGKKYYEKFMHPSIACKTIINNIKQLQ